MNHENQNLCEHLLHVSPSFAPGGAQVRAAALMNHFGSRYRHTLLAMDGDFSVIERITPAVRYRTTAPKVSPNPIASTAKLIEVLQAERPDLVLTYNWGSIEAVLAAGLSRIAPVVHAEDGFGRDEAVHQKRRRVWTRRWALRFAERVVAPSTVLIRMMRDVWRLPSDKVEYIPNGIDTARFTPRNERCSGSSELVIGTVGHLREEKRQEMLIEACARLNVDVPVRLKIAGEGPERSKLQAVAQAAGFVHKVEFLGRCTDMPQVYAQFDVFALTSSTEQMPLSVLEAMAAGLSVVSTDVGDVKQMVSEPNRPFVVSSSEFDSALRQLGMRNELRAHLGSANRLHCTQTYSVEQMFGRYESLYQGVIDKHRRN